MVEKVLGTLQIDFVLSLFGALDSHTDTIEKAFGVRIAAGENGIVITGENAENVQMAATVIEQLERISSVNGNIDINTVNYVVTMVSERKQDELSAIYNDCICLTSRGKPIKPKTVGQQNYVDKIKKNTIVFGVGPEGTGKTFLAVAMAVTALKQKQISRIVLTRPAVEAGEKLGFLPGDLQSKVDPYLRPLYDALFDMLGTETYQKYLERGNIEIAPLAYMRGRTLDDSFVILDEAQNTTPEQMKMFLTRLGFNSKMVVTGDITQIDLPDGRKSGLREVLRVLRGVEDIAICSFNEKDVVRHQLVQRIIQAYERYEKSNEGKRVKSYGKDQGRH